MATKSVARSAIGFAQICRQYNKKLNTRQDLQDRKKKQTASTNDWFWTK